VEVVTSLKNALRVWFFLPVLEKRFTLIHAGRHVYKNAVRHYVTLTGQHVTNL
jgi:hypothetical protein